MESISLYPHQEEALGKLHSGALLNGDVGSGKTYTALFFYKENFLNKDLIVITTAKKRDTNDWQEEASKIGINDITVDSWNNIKNYKKIQDSFFVFDEQRAIGYGAWAKAMIFIAKRNKWIMLTATPGDTWIDYMSVFIANGWYKHKTDFVNQHIEYDPWVKFPRIKKYHNVRKLQTLRKRILVPMDVERHTTRHRKKSRTKYDRDIYKSVMKDRWNVFKDKPIENASELTHTLRRITATDESRKRTLKFLADIHDKVIIFYNYNYELEVLREVMLELGKPYAEWNGHYHDPIPDTNEWAYLVQYTSGSEGWNCIETSIMIFYSLNYSYRIMEQSEGRIDRLNTTFEDLEYFYLTSMAPIDRSVEKAIVDKKRFNESAWAKKEGLIFQKKTDSKAN